MAQAIIASADRHGANADAGSWRPLVRMSTFFPIGVDRLALRQDRRGRLDRETRDDRLPVEMPPRIPPT